jgi:type II secretory pathway component PulF
MKKINIIYWVVTVLFALVMLSSAIPNIMNTKEWQDILKGLGYPLYMLPFLGVAKLIGIIIILIPGFPRLKEWAYAGLVIDLTAATYSIIAMGTPFSEWWLMLVFFALAFGSYYLYHKRLIKMAVR